MLLFFLVTGAFPVQGASVSEIAAAHTTGRRRRLRDVRPDLPDFFVNVVERAVASDQTRRYLSAGEMHAALGNHIRDEIRKVRTRPPVADLPVDYPDDAPSPLERAIGREGLDRYERALERLRPSDREAIIARLELQQSYEEVAIALGKPNAAAARMAVVRSVKKLLVMMDRP